MQMLKPSPLERIQALDPYAPGLSTAEIRDRYGLSRVIKLASNENPLGASPLAQEAIRSNASRAFLYPQGGNPRLSRAIAEHHGVSPELVMAGNGSDEIIDLLIRLMAQSGRHNIVCFKPCFSIYPIQARINGVEIRRAPLLEDFSFDSEALIQLVDDETRLVFVTTPDNPSGYCPPREWTSNLAAALARKAPRALLVVDEAYMDFAGPGMSLLDKCELPGNVAVLRTFSKSFGLAGMRVGYGIAPANIADAYWRARLPFSISIIAEEAALAALADTPFREATMKAVFQGRETLRSGLEALGCQVWPSHANFLFFRLPDGSLSGRQCFEKLLGMGIIIRSLGSYGLPGHLRVSIGNVEENAIFLKAMREILAAGEAVQ